MIQTPRTMWLRKIEPEMYDRQIEDDYGIYLGNTAPVDEWACAGCEAPVGYYLDTACGVDIIVWHDVWMPIDADINDAWAYRICEDCRQHEVEPYDIEPRPHGLHALRVDDRDVVVASLDTCREVVRHAWISRARIEDAFDDLLRDPTWSTAMEYEIDAVRLQGLGMSQEQAEQISRRQRGTSI